MSEATAVRVAIDLLRVPSRARLIREAPLPHGMELLLRIAAGERSAIDAALVKTERSEAVLRQAAEFFIEQILLSPESQSYRVLGANHDAPSAELRRNMALLVRWMHPDVTESVDRSMFAGRVTLAWNDLKTAERRSAYDETHDNGMGSRNARNSKKNSSRPGRRSKLRRLSTNGSESGKMIRSENATGHDAARQPSLLRRAWLLLLRRSRG